VDIKPTNEKIKFAISALQDAAESLASLQESLEKTPVEREYRAGEWVPKLGSEYWLNDHLTSDGTTFCSKNSNHRFDKYRIKSGNAFPTGAIAEAAKAHADWWREFDKIRDEAVGETARAEMYLGRITYTIPPLHIGPTSVERLGGEQKVIDMLTRGRVFRFKWGGE